MNLNFSDIPSRHPVTNLRQRIAKHPKAALIELSVQCAVIQHLESLPDDTDLNDPYHLMIVRLHYFEIWARHFGIPL